MLKIGLEEVTFGNVCSAAGGYCAEFLHRAMHGVRCFATLREVGLVFGKSGIGGALPVGHNRESKGAAHCGIHGSVFRGFDGLRRRAGQSLVEMKLDFTEAGSSI